MRLNFLWDEEKTRKLFKSYLILFTIGASFATIYALLLPPSTPYHLIIFLVPVIFTLSCFVYLALLGKPNPGLRFLLFNLESQLATTIFMAITGGFLGIVQFAPYMILLFTVFQLGSTSTLIVGVFSVLGFLAMIAWSLMFHPYPNILKEFFYYGGSYILIVIIERNIGIELNLQFEAKRRLEQVDDLKNQFIALSSHYLRTPLTIIKWSIQGLAKSTNTEGEKDEVEKITANVQVLENLVEKLLMVSSIQKGEAAVTKTPSDLNEMMDSISFAYRQIVQDKGLTFEYTHQNVFPVFSFDRVKLRRAVESILDNAVRFNKQNGVVKLSTGYDGKIVKIEVSDTGIGMSKERVDTLFVPFNRGTMKQVLNFDKPGFALSLYLAKLVVEAHGGTLEVSSREGVGSVFTILMPLQVQTGPAGTP